MEYSKAAFERALELLYFTIEDPKNRHQLREIVRAREALIDHFMCNNEYNTTDEQWLNYAAAISRGR